MTVVSPALDPNSTTVEVWVQAKNPKGRLRPGTSVRISMLARSVPNAVVIPAAAVLTAPDGTSYVMLAGSDNKAHQKTVKTGIRQGEQVQIVEGLAEGDRSDSEKRDYFHFRIQQSYQYRGSPPAMPE